MSKKGVCYRHVRYNLVKMYIFTEVQFLSIKFRDWFNISALLIVGRYYYYYYYYYTLFL
jgi:hypothetical protein